MSRSGVRHIAILTSFDATGTIASDLVLTTPNTWYDLPAGGTHNFTVGSSASVIEIVFRCGALGGSVPGSMSSRILLDGTTEYLLGMQQTISNYANVFGGSQPVFIENLAAGAHSFKIQIASEGASNHWYCRPSTNPKFEFLSVLVLEHTR